jgi:hypothetical protein
MKILNQIQTLAWHRARRWSTRELASINKIIIHQEMADGTVELVNRYHIRPNHISPLGCPHFCYHYGIEKSGEVIHANELNQVTWHTTGQNDTGIGIMLAGNFAGPGHESNTEDPAIQQLDALEELCDYLMKAFALSGKGVYGHYHFGKQACPGYIVQNWIENKRKS